MKLLQICQVLCGSDLYSFHSSSCTGTEGKEAKRHIDGQSCSAFLFFSLGWIFTQQQHQDQMKISKHHIEIEKNILKDEDTCSILSVNKYKDVKALRLCGLIQSRLLRVKS